MAGTISDIRHGLVGISHISGDEYKEMPSTKMNKPSPGNNITFHTESALNLEDANYHIQTFIRGDSLDSYSPQEQKDLRSSVMNCVDTKLKEFENQSDSVKILESLKVLLKEDEMLEQMATMSRNVLISV